MVTFYKFCKLASIQCWAVDGPLSCQHPMLASLSWTLPCTGNKGRFLSFKVLWNQRMQYLEYCKCKKDNVIIGICC